MDGVGEVQRGRRGLDGWEGVGWGLREGEEVDTSGREDNRVSSTCNPQVFFSVVPARRAMS